MAHTFCNMLVHVIFSTQGRRPLIQDSLRDRLWSYMGGVARKEFGAALLIGGTENHVHGLLSLNATASIAKAMELWKSLSSGWVHRTFPDATDFSWQTGYGAFSVSQSNAQAVKEYIAGQEEHHRVKTFEEEFVELLKRHHSYWMKMKT